MLSCPASISRPPAETLPAPPDPVDTAKDSDQRFASGAAKPPTQPSDAPHALLGSDGRCALHTTVLKLDAGQRPGYTGRELRSHLRKGDTRNLVAVHRHLLALITTHSA